MQGLNRLLENMTMKSSALGNSGQLNIAHATRLFVQTHALHGARPADSTLQSMAGVSVGANFTEGNRNYCTKHKKKFVNFCLDHGLPLCAGCFKDHQGHKIEMLENYAQAEVTKVNQLVEHLENSIRHVKEKLELRKNLNEKKEIAAKQFFDLTFEEFRRIEKEFW
jgi:hypothetical protein